MHERQIIKRIQSRLKATSPVGQVICGIGDDCAVFPSNGQDWLISTDTLVENKHFDLRWHPPYDLACKVMAVNISDIAAMGASPLYATISLTFTKQLTDSWFESFIDGIIDMHAKYKIALIGGDTVSGEKVSFTVTIIGQAQHQILYRNGAQRGDSIYVGGALGSAGGGLYLFKKDYTSPVAARATSPHVERRNVRYSNLIKSHLHPTPQVALGEALAATGYVTAMQDISDGLATDLAHIAEQSGLQAVIFEEKIPVLPELRTLAKEYDLSLSELALSSGDDYLLLFTVKNGGEQEVENVAQQVQCPIYKIGHCTIGEGVQLIDSVGHARPIAFGGYEHS